MDFGLGIGYNPESNNTVSSAAPSRSAAVNSLKTNMMAQFKSNFVAAKSSSENQAVNNVSGAYKRTVLPGFVSGGTIGGNMNASQTSSFSPATAGGGTTTQRTENTSQR